MASASHILAENFTHVRSAVLRIKAVLAQDAGRYQCEASVFLEKRHKKMNPSNELAVMVTRPGEVMSGGLRSMKA